MKKFLKTTLNFLVYVAIIATVVLGLPKFMTWALETQYPMAAITSGSMWPKLKQGDLVLIQGISKDELKIGDVIVFKNETGNGFTIHRIVKLGENNFTTKGDANFEDDKPTAYKYLVGRNLTIWGKPARIPWIGNITTFASKKFNLAAVINKITAVRKL